MAGSAKIAGTSTGVETFHDNQSKWNYSSNKLNCNGNLSTNDKNNLNNDHLNRTTNITKSVSNSNPSSMVDFTGEVKFNTPDSLKEQPVLPPTKTTRRKKGALGSASVVTNGTGGSNPSFQSRTAASTHGSATYSGAGSTLSRTNREMEAHDKRSKLVVKRLKLAILLFFTLTAVGVATAFFVYRSHNEQTRENNFKKNFKEEAYNMLANIGANMDSTLGAADAFTVSMLAQAQDTNQTYPYVTINNFAVQAGKLLKNSRAKYIATYNMVPKGERKTYEEYTKTHNSWTDQSIEVQSRDPGYKGPEITEEFINENFAGHYDLIHDYDEAIYEWGNSTDGVDHDGPFLPVWQCAPVIPIDPIYGWDFLSNNAYPAPLDAILDTHLITITEPYMINWPWDEDFEYEHQMCAEWIKNYLEPGEDPREPAVDIYYPILPELINNVRYFDAGYSASNSSGYDASEDKLAGLLSITLYWRDALRDLLPSASAGVVVVFKNPCDVPPFGYEITGPTPKYLNVGYHNDTMMGDPDLNITTSLLGVWDFGVANSSYTGVPVNENICPYTIEVYPAASARDQFMENNDNSVYVVLILVLIVSIMTIAFTFLFFFLYDRLVRSEIQSKINLLDAKRNFVRFVSHEVRTPLNTVCMGLTLMLTEFQNREKQLAKNEKNGESVAENDTTKEDFARWSSLTQEVNNNADVAVGVLNDLLNIDKIQMGAFKLDMEVLPIWEIVEQTTSEFSMMAAKQKTKLKLDLSKLAKDDSSKDDVEKAITHTSMLPSRILNQILVGDEQRLRQVLRNLLSNALKFAKNGKVTVRVHVRDQTSPSASMKDMSNTATKEVKMADGSRRIFSSSGRIVVDVVDNGVGMTPAQLETVFDVGTQFNAKTLQSGGGSGLGLAFAKAIVEQHSGSLLVYSDGKDKGTTFRLDMPLHLDDEASTRTPVSSATSNKKELEDNNLPGPASQKEDSDIEDELEPMSILVVDDAPMNRKLLVRLLEANGHTCEQAENGQDLIDNVKQNMVQYDCILVDYEMPVMNGPEACKGVREMGYTGFVVGVTGNLLPEDIGYFMDCGADAVLPKPFKYKELEELLIEHGMFDLS